MTKRIFPADDLSKSNRLAKGKSTYPQSASTHRQVITRGRVAKRMSLRKEK